MTEQEKCPKCGGTLDPGDAFCWCAVCDNRCCTWCSDRREDGQVICDDCAMRPEALESKKP